MQLHNWCQQESSDDTGSDDDDDEEEEEPLLDLGLTEEPHPSPVALADGEHESRKDSRSPSVPPPPGFILFSSRHFDLLTHLQPRRLLKSNQFHQLSSVGMV
jgi:hypothetical protein